MSQSMLASAAMFATAAEATMPNRDPRWLRASEAADLVGVDKSTIWRWQRAGRLSDVKTYRPGTETLYWRPDLEAFVRQRGGDVGDEKDRTTE